MVLLELTFYKALPFRQGVVSVALAAHVSPPTHTQSLDRMVSPGPN